MKKRIIILFILLLVSKLVLGQVIIGNNDELKGYKAIPQESVFIHFNSSLLFTGEYLYYSLYCFNNQTKSLTDLSKVAYVELIGKDNQAVFLHKIKLDNGKGMGDFFIPVTVSSGNYKLVAYTNWMKNSNPSKVFQTDINIINPYQSNPSTVQKNKDSKVDSLASKSPVSNTTRSKIIEDPKENEGFLIMETDQENYKNRSKVNVQFRVSNTNKMGNGNYSISVRKMNGIPKPKSESSSEFLKGLSNKMVQQTENIGSQVELPELRGELFSGKAVPLNTDLNVDNLKVAISIPGDNYFFEIVHTNEKGEFFVNIDKNYPGDQMYLQVLGDHRSEYKIETIEHQNITNLNLQFNEFKIDPSWKNEIIEQSVHNQIESAYFEFKPDSILLNAPDKMLDNFKRETYNLDDYTRFPTLRETFIEIVKNVSTKKMEKDTYGFEIQGYEFNANTGISPLVLVDGIVVQNINNLLDYKASKVKEISIFRDQFVIGMKAYQGIIEIKTISGTYDNIENDPTIFKTSIFKPQIRKNYFTQVYDEASQNSRIPDDRLQLLWIPHLELQNASNVEFYTSDVDGEFEISFEGFTKDGKPVSLKRTFFVD